MAAHHDVSLLYKYTGKREVPINGSVLFTFPNSTVVVTKLYPMEKPMTRNGSFKLYDGDVSLHLPSIDGHNYTINLGERNFHQAFLFDSGDGYAVSLSIVNGNFESGAQLKVQASYNIKRDPTDKQQKPPRAAFLQAAEHEYEQDEDEDVEEQYDEQSQGNVSEPEAVAQPQAPSGGGARIRPQVDPQARKAAEETLLALREAKKMPEGKLPSKVVANKKLSAPQHPRMDPKDSVELLARIYQMLHDMTNVDIVPPSPSSNNLAILGGIAGIFKAPEITRTGALTPTFIIADANDGWHYGIYSVLGTRGLVPSGVILFGKDLILTKNKNTRVVTLESVNSSSLAPDLIDIGATTATSAIDPLKLATIKELSSR